MVTPEHVDPAADVAACQSFEDVAVGGRLAVGHQYCPLPVGGPAAFINGKLQVDGAANVQDLAVSGAAVGKSLGLSLAGAAPSAAKFTADETASGQLALSGSLRIAAALGIGMPTHADVGLTARAVVRGDGSQTTPLHVWQDASGAALAMVDAEGRVGIGGASTGASLSVRPRHTHALDGKITGWDGRTDFLGTNTHFLTQLRDGETIRIQGASPEAYDVVTRTDDTHLTVKQSPKANFEQRTGFVESAPLQLTSGTFGSLFGVDRYGRVTCAEALAVEGSAHVVKELTVSGHARFATESTFKGTATFEGVVKAAQFVGDGAVITGMIVMWSGSAQAIPAGWALCDGTRGTPDLRSRFVVGAGPGGNPPYNPGESGEADTHDHLVGPTASSGQTNSTGSHGHKFPDYWYDRNMGAGGNTAIDVRSVPIQTSVTRDAGVHAHTVTATTASVTSAKYGGANRPKWYALCLIAKL